MSLIPSMSRYWLGLDENVIPPAGQPFYAPFNASYPTFGRITEVMNTLQTMGAHLIRSQTLGVSVGNPLSIMPSLEVYNEQAFATIDWAVFQARQHGLRIMAPLVDNYVFLQLHESKLLLGINTLRTTIMAASSIFCGSEVSISHQAMLPKSTPSSRNSTPTQPLCKTSRTTSPTF